MNHGAECLFQKSRGSGPCSGRDLRPGTHHHLYEPRRHCQLCKAWRCCHNPQSRQTIQRVIDWFAADKNHNLVYTYHNVKQNKDVYMVALRDADGTLIGYYEKHEYRSSETMRLYDME